MKLRSVFSKIISELKSERETQISREEDTIEITYPAISKEDLQNNWYVIPITLLFSLFCIIGAIVALTGTLSSFAEMPYETPSEEKYILLLPILFCMLWGIGIPIFVYRKVIRPLFITEKLTLHPSYFIYSLGIWGNFKEVIHIRKTDLVSFAIRGNLSPILRFISKGSDGKNHLYVHYNKKKKKEIMGGRSDDEYREMIDILESYRISTDIYNMAKTVKESEKTEQTESEPQKREGGIKKIRKLLSSEPLEEKDCLKINGIIGLLTLPGILFSL